MKLRFPKLEEALMRSLIDMYEVDSEGMIKRWKEMQRQDRLKSKKQD